MRYKRNLSMNIIKTDKILTEYKINNKITYILDNNKSNININLVLKNNKLIKFNNIIYSNESSEYEFNDGIIINVDTENPTLIIYKNISSNNFVDFNINNKTESNIILNLDGKNISQGGLLIGIFNYTMI